MPMMRSYIFILYVLSLFSFLVKAEDGASWGAGVDEDGNYYNKFSVCDDTEIQIDDMSALCDSPGAYYYGSNKYRNSYNCMGGDKAKVEIEFVIAEELEDGVTPYVSVSLEASYGNIETQVLYEDAELCSISGLASVYGDECPSVGTYTISEVFYWPEQDDGYDAYSFVPKIIVGMSSEQGTGDYDLGGANADQCNNYRFGWTTGVRKTFANTLRTFLITFGILAGCVVVVSAFAVYIVRKAKRKRRKEQIIEEDFPENANNYHKINYIGQNRDLVNF